MLEDFIELYTGLILADLTESQTESAISELRLAPEFILSAEITFGGIDECLEYAVSALSAGDHPLFDSPQQTELRDALAQAAKLFKSQWHENRRA
jgi:hypothetical protein